MNAARRVIFALISIILILGLSQQPAAARGAASQPAAHATLAEIRGDMTAALEPSAAGPGPHEPALDDPAYAPARVTWSTIMTQTFEGTFPSGAWATYDADGAVSGEYKWDDDDFKPHNGTKSAWAAGGGANALDPASSDYANNMDSWMVYGPFDLSPCSMAAFEFYYWNDSEEGVDWFSWGASADGTTFNEELRSGDSGGWQYESQDLAAYVGDSSVWLAFHFTSDSSDTAMGPFVDDVALSCGTGPVSPIWTFMVYLNGDNELEAQAVDDFLEMSSAGSSAQVNVVAQMDRIAGNSADYGDWTSTKRFRITTGMEPTAANGTDLGELNMGDPQTLSDFITWAKTTYPATYYALVVWDHSTGCSAENSLVPLTDGIAFDDSSTGDSLSMPELRSALATATNNGASPLNIVGLDACLMGSIEVDNQIRPYASTRVGSEETEPPDGWPYDTILSTLRGSPSINPATLATTIVDEYYAFYEGDYTQSAVRLGTAYDTLNSAVNTFAQAMTDHGSDYIAELRDIRNFAVTQFGGLSYVDVGDFADWVQIYVTEPTIYNAAIAVKDAVSATVIHEHHGGSWLYATGTNIYFPKTDGEYDTRYDGSAGLLQFTANSQWDEFIHQYHEFLDYPAMFYKSGPADGASGQPVLMTLSWASSAGAAEYDYCLNTTNDGTCNVSLSGTTSETSVQVGLSPSTTYYWQVTAVNPYGAVSADYNARWSFATGALPGTFAKSAPANGATDKSLSPTLSWGPSAEADYYEYCIDTTNDNACDGWTNNGNTTSKALSGLSPFTTYYWHVRAWNEVGPRYSNWSATAFWSFTTGGDPEPFGKISPANGATKQPLNLALSWQTSDHAASYEYCIDTVSNTTCDGAWTSTGTNTSVPLSGLSLNTVYYWQVRASASLSTVPADGGTWWSFTTGNLPGAFNKTSPVNAALTQPLSLLLTWTESSDADRYEYCYDTSSGTTCDGSWVNNGTGTSASINGLSLNTVYYWHVRAVNAFGTRASNGGTWWSFTTGDLPGTFGKSAPANASPGVVLNPVLSWATSAGAASYQFCYDMSNDSACSASWTSVESLTNAPLSGLSMATTYYWQVRAVNSFGERYANSGTWWTFTTGSLPGGFAKSAPANGASDQPLNLTLTWATSAGAASYEYCYDTSDDGSCTDWTGNSTSTSKALSGLSQYTTYFWHVRALNNIGTRYSDDAETSMWSFTTGGDPGLFGKTGPSNAAVKQLLSLNLTWEPSSNAVSYEFCMDTINNATCEDSWVNVGSSTGKALSGLSMATTYYWQVRAINTFNTRVADGDIWWSFTTGDIPGTFSKSSPGNAASGQLLNLTLSWAASSDTESYEYCYDTTSGTVCDAGWTSAGTATSAAISGLSAGTTYYWHVRAINTFGTRPSNGGTWWSFTTGNYPATFGKTAPGDTATNRPLSVALSWAASAGAASYAYCVDQSDNAACDGSWADNGAATSVQLNGLSLATTYYWQVRASNAIGERLANNGAWWSFTTGHVPEAFAKSGPANGATNQPLSLTVSWGAALDVSSYAYCYDTTDDSACDGSWASTGLETSAVLSGLSAGTTYYWQVTASNEFGERMADSGAWWAFTTGTPPAGFGKLVPADGSGPTSPEASLSWGTSADAIGYEYCFDTSDDDACGGTWIGSGLDTAVDPAGIFLPGNMYYWQVRAMNAIGPTYADGGDWWSFVTTPPIVGMLRSKGAQDGWVLESSELSGTGGTLNSALGTFYVGDDAARRQYRGILSFDTSGLSDTGVITSVTLKVKKAGVSGNPYATLGKLGVDIKTGFLGTSGSLQLADFRAPASKSMPMTIANTPSGGWYSATLNPLYFLYINRDGLTQLRLRFTKDDDNDAMADFLKFYSGNAGTAAYRPLLVIEYYEP